MYERQIDLMHEEALAIEKNAQKMASQLHENWRATRLQADCSFSPRLKTTTDSAWISAHEGNNQVDIANTIFSELPRDWQRENYLAALTALILVVNNPLATLEQLAAEIHDAWLERNGWAKNDLKLGLPYAELAEEEKDKDKAHITMAFALLS